MKQKHGKSMLGRLDGFKLRVPGSLLVFETTGFCLYGIVARRGVGGSLACSAPAMSAAPDFAAAVGEVLEQLRAQTKRRLPGKAALITPSAAGELLLLPVDPKSPKPRAQMRELVRWEFEEVFVRQNDIWPLGALLQGRSHVTPEQRRELETAAASARDRGTLLNAYRELVSREQLEECLAMQEPLTAMDDELAIGWSPQPGADEEGRFAWYCAGIGDGLRTQWVQAFKKHGVFCGWIYPQLGAGFPLVVAGRDGRLLVDIRQEQFGLFQGAGGRLDSISIRSCPHGMAEPDAVAADAAKCIHPGTRVVYVSAPPEGLDPVIGALKQALGEAEIRPLPLPPPDASGVGAAPGCPPTVSASLEGVARHALRLCGPGLLARIEAQPPRPPLWKSRGFWPWAIIALVLVAMAGTELFLRVQAGRKEWALELMDIEYERQLQIKNEAVKTQTEIKHLEKVFAEKEHELMEKKRRMEVLNNVILRRQKLVPGLLEAISEAIPGEVMMDLLVENNDGSGFSLEGWALRDTEGQRFGNLLNEKLAPWNYKVGDIRLSRGKGRSGIEGFILKVRLVKTDAPGGGKDA
ncbi:hypothetical protein AW736_07160 [Termitidicoccus mucosus]|uniref:Fimbrial assembly protein n=2 Tax=Termitidicoccus mucosus TaxID=1184151 RepID=A0A178IL07_9BACT|nr:hypothetical protein AW736_07160 [Opitutaceae bacterium TSB47]